MKKVIYSLLGMALITGVIYSCKKEITSNSIASKQNEIISDFTNSESFKRVKDQIESYGNISTKDISLDSIIVKDEGTFHYFTVPIIKDGKINASLDVVDLNDTKNLPHNDKYAMNLNDITDLNIKNLTGKIRLFDLNYDFKYSEVDLKNNKIENIEYIHPSEESLMRYRKIRLKSIDVAYNYSNITYGKAKSTIPCDANGNKNLSFFECYGCFKTASEAKNTFGEWWCDVPVAGHASCWATMSTACVILSSIY